MTGKDSDKFLLDVKGPDTRWLLWKRMQELLCYVEEKEEQAVPKPSCTSHPSPAQTPEPTGFIQITKCCSELIQNCHAGP